MANLEKNDLYQCRVVMKSHNIGRLSILNHADEALNYMYVCSDYLIQYGESTLNATVQRVNYYYE